MRRAVVTVLVGLLGSLVGCASVLGLEPLEVLDGGADALADASEVAVDTGDSGSDAPLDVLTDAPADAPDVTPDACAVDAPSTAPPFTGFVHPLWPAPASSPGVANYVVTSSCGDGLVTDKTTGLVWAQQIEPGTFTWAEAKARCAASRRGGFTDWRLPTRIELTSLVDFAKGSVPAIDTSVFLGSTSSPAWSISPYANFPSQGWFVDFSKGNTWYGNASDVYQARCVRGGKTSSPRYSTLGASEVKDNFTGLVWSVAEEAGASTWADAATKCTARGSGYRLPTIRELESLVDETATGAPTIDRVVFTAATSGPKWSSSPYVYASGLAWRVDFAHGDSGTLATTSTAGVRCVR